MAFTDLTVVKWSSICPPVSLSVFPPTPYSPISEKKKNYMAVFYICKDIESNNPCSTRFSFAFSFDSHTDFAYVFCNLVALQRIILNAFKKLLVVLFKTWIFLSETFCFFCEVVRNRYGNITTHRANSQQTEVYAFRQWLPLPPSKRF